MQFHKHLIKKKKGISESLIAIGADLTNIHQGRRINQNVGGALSVTMKGSQASK